MNPKYVAKRQNIIQTIEKTLLAAKNQLLEITRVATNKVRLGKRNVIYEIVRNGARLMSRVVEDTPLNRILKFGTELFLNPDTRHMVKKQQLLEVDHRLTRRTKKISEKIKLLEAHMRRNKLISKEVEFDIKLKHFYGEMELLKQEVNLLARELYKASMKKKIVPVALFPGSELTRLLSQFQKILRGTTYS